ncbi:MAG: winged helix-turn-helix domain-containing protein, partial [Aquabacterium sp.]|nr:winged helix-turn-helix domain-containing protein [Aquabacterium sp.]
MSAPPSTVALPGHVVDLARHALLTADGQRVELRPQALDLLCLLAARAGETVDKRHLIDVVWPGLVVTDDSLVQAVGDIRRAIGDNQHQVLQTVPRRGYRLIAAVPAPAIEPAPGATDTPPRPSSPPTPVADGAPTPA